MKKITRLFYATTFLLALGFNSNAQNAREATVKVNKADQNAVVADYQYNSELIQKALEEKLSKAGLGKSKSKNGFKLYAGVNWPEISSDKLDVYYKVDGKKDNSTAIVLISKGYDNYITSAKEPEMVAKVQAVLNNLVNDARILQLQQQIDEQTKVVKNGEEKCNNLKSDNEKLKREKDKIEKEISKNEEDQKQCESTLQTEKKKLEELNSKK